MEREDAVDDILSYLTLCEERTARGGVKTPLSSYQELEPLALGLTTPDRTFSTDNTPADIDSNYNIGLIVRSEGGFSAQTFRRVGPQALRGRVKVLPPTIVEWSIAAMRPQGDALTDKFYLGHYGNRWKTIYPASTSISTPDDLQLRLSVATQIQFERRYLWRAVLGYPGTASISLHTTPEGSKALFKLRDVPDGKERRAALRNWVTEHWRKKAADPAESVRVREHLRGATDFSWRGLSVRLIPAPYEVETKIP